MKITPSLIILVVGFIMGLLINKQRSPEKLKAIPKNADGWENLSQEEEDYWNSFVD